MGDPGLRRDDVVIRLRSGEIPADDVVEEIRLPSGENPADDVAEKFRLPSGEIPADDVVEKFRLPSGEIPAFAGMTQLACRASPPASPTLGPKVPAWRYLAQLPQGRKTARVSELFRVRGGPFTSGPGMVVRS